MHEINVKYAGDNITMMNYAWNNRKHLSENKNETLPQMRNQIDEKNQEQNECWQTDGQQTGS